MFIPKIAKNIIEDMEKTIVELHSKELIRDDRQYSQKSIQGGVYEISFPGKNESRSIVYDKHITTPQMIDTLLEGKQYNILFYDKGLIQAEFKVKGNEIIKAKMSDEAD